MKVLRRRIRRGWASCVLGLSVLLAAGPASAQQLAAGQSHMAANCVPDSWTVDMDNFVVDQYGPVYFRSGTHPFIYLQCPIDLPPWQAGAAPVFDSITIYFDDPDGSLPHAYVYAEFRSFNPALNRHTILKTLWSNLAGTTGYSWITAPLNLTLDPKSYSLTYYLNVILYRSYTSLKPKFYSYAIAAH